MFTLSTAAELGIRAVARRQLPDLDPVEIAGGSDYIKIKLGDFAILTDLPAHNEHAKPPETVS
jgi:hypothetical protein